jgi:hypothetical protein
MRAEILYKFGDETRLGGVSIIEDMTMGEILAKLREIYRPDKIIKITITGIKENK